MDPNSRAFGKALVSAALPETRRGGCTRAGSSHPVLQPDEGAAPAGTAPEVLQVLWGAVGLAGAMRIAVASRVLAHARRDLNTLQARTRPVC